MKRLVVRRDIVEGITERFPSINSQIIMLRKEKVFPQKLARDRKRHKITLYSLFRGSKNEQLYFLEKCNENPHFTHHIYCSASKKISEFKYENEPLHRELFIQIFKDIRDGKKAIIQNRKSKYIIVNDYFFKKNRIEYWRIIAHCLNNPGYTQIIDIAPHTDDHLKENMYTLYNGRLLEKNGIIEW